MTVEDLTEIINDSPVVLYVDNLIVEMISNDCLTKTICPSAIPEIEDCEGIDFNEVDYNRIVNRLKIMSGLNPWPSKEEIRGEILLRVAGGAFTASITVAPNDQSIKIDITKNS